jgi:Protein of unknown function (DUF3592)
MLLGAAVLALFTGMCTVLAGAVTAWQAWQQHAQALWPVANGTVQTCDIKRSSNSQRKREYIRCEFNYTSDTGSATAGLSSAYFYPPDVPQYPANQQQPFVGWLNAHSTGKPVKLRYNPADHARVLLADNPMPRSGPHTRDNLTLLIAFGGIFLAALTAARLLRPRGT